MPEKIFTHHTYSLLTMNRCPRFPFKWFKQDGYHVETAEDATHALRLMNKGRGILYFLILKCRE